jgi:hypothetical protein
VELARGYPSCVRRHVAGGIVAGKPDWSRRRAICVMNISNAIFFPVVLRWAWWMERTRPGVTPQPGTRQGVVKSRDLVRDGRDPSGETAFSVERELTSVLPPLTERTALMPKGVVCYGTSTAVRGGAVQVERYSSSLNRPLSADRRVRRRGRRFPLWSAAQRGIS